jgi:sigma-B regulation protein RsbU (phosphoserine phosphatase)
VKQGGKILIVDDEQLNLMVLKGILTKAGLDVTSASSGVEALELAHEHKPDMVLLDVMMPGESGFDICQQLKQNISTSQIPVIFVTCLSQAADKLTGLNLGAVDYITKPYSAPEVVARVRTHLDSRRKQTAIIEAQASRLGQVQAAQQALLVKPEELPVARFAAHFVPILEAGGDFYDVLDLGAGNIGYFLADVSGHDLGASFITSSLKALFRQHASASMDVRDTLSAMNNILHAITPEELYLTALYLRVNRTLGTYEVTSAAHPPALLQQNGGAMYLDQGGSPLGMFPSVELDVRQGTVQGGDRFFLYTDGLVDLYGAQFTTDPGFRAAFAESCAAIANSDIGEGLRQVCSPKSESLVPRDDVLLLGVIV